MEHRQAARVMSLRVPRERLEEVSDIYRSTLIPELQERVPGFSALLLLVNEEAGSAIEITLFESEEDRRITEEDGGMVERKLEVLADILDEPPRIETHELKLIS
jgi:hypothetical protein